MYAMVAVGDKQYCMTKGEVLLVDRMEAAPGTVFSFEKVLLVRKDDQILVGKPHVQGARVECKVLSEEKGEKIKVERLERRKGVKKIIGHRQKYTRIKVQDILS